MNFYIASKLENAERVRELAEQLEQFGWKCTYKWYEHGMVLYKEDLQAAAAEELSGIIRADLFVMLFPAGRGSHVELGFALARAKDVVIHCEEQGFLSPVSDFTRSFYWLPQVQRVCCPFEELPVRLKEKYVCVLENK